jgi:hypothetical protein
VNFVQDNLQLAGQNLTAASRVQDAAQLGPRIERCEFEQLLQRAMEILNARDVKGQLKKAT